MNIDTSAINKLFGLLAYNPIELSFESSTIHGLSIIEADVDEPILCLIAR